MASATMDMASATASMDMGSMSSSTMDMGGMDMGGMDHMDHSMHMYFVGDYLDYPVLFKGLTASNGGQAFGIFLLLFVIGVFVRGLDFTSKYLEQVVWQNPNYVDACHTPSPNGVLNVPLAASNCCGENTGNDPTADSIRKNNSSSLDIEQQEHEGPYATSQPSKLPMASMLFRNIIRLALCILPELFGFALMLAAMTFSVLYFFAVILGLGIGRFIFDRLSDRMNIRPSASIFHC
ncbi:MAG: copper transporter family protein [Staphylococcus equorum]|nr:copper transporter family protein [Staphylococcus equorum]